LIACSALVVTLGLAVAMPWPERRASDPGVGGVGHATGRAEETPAVRREKWPTLALALYEGKTALAYLDASGMRNAGWDVGRIRAAIDRTFAN